MFEINGQSFDVGIVSLQRGMKKTYKYQVVTQDGTHRSEIKAIYPEYSLTLGAITQSEYDRLYTTVNTTEQSVAVTLPYNQEQITFPAEIEIGQDGILLVESDGTYRWDAMTLNITGIEPLKVNRNG